MLLMKLLIETIIEGGPLTEEECTKALAGRAETPEMRAVMSRIEYAIGKAREDSEALGQKPQTRDEACGAAVHLRLLREEIKNMLVSDRRAEHEA